MANETELLYLILLMVFTLILHFILARRTGKSRQRGYMQYPIDSGSGRKFMNPT